MTKVRTICILTVRVENSPTQNSLVHKILKSQSKVQKKSPIQKLSEIVPKIVQKTVPLIEVITAPEVDEKSLIGLKTFWYQLNWMIISSITEKLEQPT